MRAIVLPSLHGILELLAFNNVLRNTEGAAVVSVMLEELCREGCYEFFHRTQRADTQTFVQVQVRNGAR